MAKSSAGVPKEKDESKKAVLVNDANKAPSTKPIVVVVVRKKKKRKHSFSCDKRKPGLPHLSSKQLTDAQKHFTSDDTEGFGYQDNDDIVLFPPMEDAIPCDTLLAVQALTSPSQSHWSLDIPLLTSSEVISCCLESQIYPFLQQGENDHESLGMVTRELQDLFRKNMLRRLFSIGSGGGSGGGGGGGATAVTDLTVLVETKEYLRGVWDAHYGTDGIPSPELQMVQAAYVQWFADHLHCWTGRMISMNELTRTWHQYPPPQNLQYQAIISLTHALEYFQSIQIIMANHNQLSGGGRGGGGSNETQYQLWLPHWGTVLSALQTAQKKFIQKLQQTYQKELSEKSFISQPFYNKISTRLLLQWLQDHGRIRMVPKPFGNFIKLVIGPGNNNDKK